MFHAPLQKLVRIEPFVASVHECYQTVVRRMVKVKLFLCLTKHHTMNMDWVNDGIAPRILDLRIRRR